jgi:hypothetical protein
VRRGVCDVAEPQVEGLSLFEASTSQVTNETRMGVNFSVLLLIDRPPSRKSPIITLKMPTKMLSSIPCCAFWFTAYL